MKRSFLLTAAILIVHCSENTTLTPPQITVDLSPVRVGGWTIEEEADPKVFDLHIRNIGEETLKITSAKIRHDQNCAFSWEGPDKKELGENQSAFVRITYKPKVRGEDKVTLVVNSNSEKHPKFIIPICARGLHPSELPEPEDTEGDTGGDSEGAGGANADTDSGEVAMCEAPPDDQPDCSEESDSEGSK
jgi:hypothetical protein